jgi:phosphoribosylaminoimidazole-succinocarboxamide synthase
LEPAIPNKGKHLTTLTNWWFERLPVENHVSNEVSVPAEVQGRATVAKKLEMFPIECVVRGYLSGSGWKEYQDKGEICGVELPEGQTFGGKLPRPIFTPAFKADLGDHDENISFEKVVEIIGLENAERLRALSLEIFTKASELAERAGLILADTKFEFGIDPATGFGPRQPGSAESAKTRLINRLFATGSPKTGIKPENHRFYRQKSFLKLKANTPSW